MFTSRFATGVVAVILTAASMVAVAPSASAAVPDLSYLGAFSAKNSDVYKAVQVLCPPGKKIFGGSFDLQGAEGAIVLDDFIPFDNGVQSGLIVGAGEIVGPGESSDTSGTSAQWQIAATAVCGTPPPGYAIHRQSSVFPNLPSQTADATCPGEKRVLGAGASLTNGFGQVSVSVLEIVSTSSVRATGLEDKDRYSEQWVVTAYAICADATLPGWGVAFNRTPVDNSVTKTTTALCPGPVKVTGAAWGIFRHSDNQDDADRYIVRTNLANTPGPTNTATAVATEPGSERWMLEAYVVCADGRVV